jgi:FixJ family two-component response regulator
MPPVVHIVGNDASFQTATGHLLKQAGYEVASYPSAEHFLGHLPNENVLGCILLKVRMQGLSGPALQKRLNDLGSALPIIFITRYLDIPTTVRAIKAGAFDFLIVRGHTNKHAARSLGCAERTIKAHRHRVMEKMQVQSLAELVSVAERVGVMSDNGISA